MLQLQLVCTTNVTTSAAGNTAASKLGKIKLEI
jgi:hypothetical protein